MGQMIDTDGLALYDQEYVQPIIGGLGTAAAKNFTTTITAGSHDLIESGSVKAALDMEIDTLRDAMFLRSEQGVLGAKNLLEITSSTTTINGITFTVNADKSVTVNGTATANTNLRLIPYDDIDLSLWTGKPLRLSGCPSGGSNSTYALEIYYKDEQEHWVRDIGDGVELSIPISGIITINPNIMIKNGATVNNLVFKPMLRLASDPDDTYVPYAMTNRELMETVNILPREIFVTTDTRTTTTNDANTLPCGFTRMNDLNSNLPTDGTGGSAVWYDILTVRQSNNPSKATWGYGFQLAVQTTTNANMGDTYVRAVNGGETPAWSAWKKLN